MTGYFLTIKALICCQLLHLLPLIKPVQNSQEFIWITDKWMKTLESYYTVCEDTSSRNRGCMCHETRQWSRWMRRCCWWSYRWTCWPLSRGWLSSKPTVPSTGDSVFRDTGTNREVSGALGGDLLEETLLLQTVWCCSLNEPGPEVAWRLPAAMRAARLLMWRWSREKADIQRLADIVGPRCQQLLWATSKNPR